MRHEFMIDDVVSWAAQGKTFRGRIVDLEGESATVSLFGDALWDEERSVPVGVLIYEPPVKPSLEELKCFARFEISYAELTQGREYAEIDFDEPYLITMDDLKAAVQNCIRQGMDDDEFGEEYFWHIWADVDEAVGLREAMYGPEWDEADEMPVPNEYAAFRDAWEVLSEKYGMGDKDPDLEEVVTEVETWEANKDKPLPEREYTRRQKVSFLTYWDDGRLGSAGEDVKAAYRKILDSLCEEDDPHALEAKAYACYGDGNAAYGQDWQESLKCLLRLMDLKPNPQTANTLGYMYYYGRCSGGVPDYDKAFYYFSIGAAGGYYESRYKLSDMFRHGYGVGKNPEVAAVLIWELYNDQLKQIRNGEFDSKFADVALRAGNIWKEGIDCDPDPDAAFYYYLQARYAIRMRMLTDEGYGDRGISEGIERAISEILPETRYAKRENTVSYYSLYFLLQNGLKRKHRMEMRIRRISDTEAKLTFRIVPYKGESHRPKLFVTVPEAHFCGLLNKVSVRAKDIDTFKVPADTDTVQFDSVMGDGFYLYGKKVAEIDAEFVFTAPSGGGKKHSFASVTFTSGGRKYDYRCDIPAEPGDRVVVPTREGEAVVTVVSVFERSESELALPLKSYKEVLRKAEDEEP